MFVTITISPKNLSILIVCEVLGDISGDAIALYLFF